MTHLKDTVKLGLAINSPSFRPGETVTALLHASTSLPEHVELQDMEVFFSGIERIDTSWVSPAYRRSVPSINTDKRRVQRYVVQSKLQAATQGAFSDSNVRRFLIRFVLSSWLPPSFKGVAVRYSYYIEAKVNYIIYDEPINQDAPEAPRKGTPMVATIRVPLQIWPDHKEQGFANGESSTDGSIGTVPESWDYNTGGGGGGNSSAPHSGQGDAFLPGIQLKCWEVGPGTAVEDAISHIIKLGPGLLGRSGSGNPFSPRHQQQQRDSSMTLPSDAGSEISHDDASGRGSEKGSRQSTASLSRQLTSDAERPLLGVGGMQGQEAAAGGGPGIRTFSLRIDDLPLVRVCIHPPLGGSIQPGSALSGSLEFPSDTTGSHAPPSLRCVKVTVLLETEELVENVWKPPRQVSTNTSGGGGLRRVYDEYVEVTADALCTHFVFSLPPDATPTFQTALVGLRWVLRFHFVAQRQESGKMEQLAWTLPVVVLPPQNC